MAADQTIVDRKETVDEALMATPDEKLLLKSGTALGHGNIEGVNTVVYVRPENSHRQTILSSHAKSRKSTVDFSTAKSATF